MKKRTRFDNKLAKLERLREKALSTADLDNIRTAVGETNNFIVSKAAEIAADRDLRELNPDLVEAYNYFSIDPLKRDSGCLAKTAIVKSLNRLDYFEDDLFLQGVTHRQMEPVYGGKADTAADLRSSCAVALVRIGHPEVFFTLTNMLVDDELQPRITAVEGLFALASEQSELLLRLKCLTGDNEPRVLDACFTGLIAINPDRSIPFVAQFLSAADLPVAEAAALALGESRKLEAFYVLKNHWNVEEKPEIRKLLILPICLTQQTAAFDFLLAIIAEEHLIYAFSALKSLEIFKHDPSLNRRIEASVNLREDEDLTEVYLQAFKNG